MNRTHHIRRTTPRAGSASSILRTLLVILLAVAGIGQGTPLDAQPGPDHSGSRLALLLAKSWPPALHALRMHETGIERLDRFDVLYVDTYEDLGLGGTVWTCRAPNGFFWLTRADFEERIEEDHFAQVGVSLETDAYIGRLSTYSAVNEGRHLLYVKYLSFTNVGCVAGSVILRLLDMRTLLRLLGDALREQDSVLVAIGMGGTVDGIEAGLAMWNEEARDGRFGEIEFDAWPTLLASMYLENACRALQNFLVTGELPRGSDEYGRYYYPNAELDPMPAGTPATERP